MYESKDKMVSHPEHYQSANGLEVIDCIEAFTEGLDGIEATDTGNIIKYACRWKKKNGKQDLEKIIWYAQHLIDHLDKKKLKEHSGRYPLVTHNVNDLGRSIYDIAFATYDDAKKIYDELSERLKRYSWITVADLYDICGLTYPTESLFSDECSIRDYGWYRIYDSVDAIMQFNIGPKTGLWSFHMPDPVLLDKDINKEEK